MDKVNISPYVAPGIQYGITKNWARTEMLELLEKLCIIYELPLERVLSRSRKAEYVYVRQLYCYYLRTEFQRKPPYPLIGDILGGRDHTTAIHSENTYRDRLISDSPLPNMLTQSTANTKEDYTATISMIYS